ncbi:hypothetical protein EGP98_02220 [bacterium]|nr:hypothetical protein [bacterium]
MEEINLMEFFDYYLARVVYVLATILAFVLLGSIYSFVIKKPLYQSSTTVVLARSNDDTQKYTQSDVLLNQNLVPTYSNIIKSRSVLRQVINNEKLDYTADELSNLITVSSVENTEIIKVTVKNQDRELAKRIANGIVPVFTNKVQGFYNIDNVSVLDTAELASRPCNINYPKDLVIFIMLGFVLSSGVIFVIYYFDTTIKNTSDIEDKLKLTVLGTVPNVNRG